MLTFQLICCETYHGDPARFYFSVPDLINDYTFLQLVPALLKKVGDLLRNQFKIKKIFLRKRFEQGENRIFNLQQIIGMPKICFSPLP